MYIPNPYFKNVPQIGDMILDYVFVEDGYPILFTCISGDRLFLCLCRTLTPNQKWVISEINFSDLEKLIKNEISVRDAFKAHPDGKSCVVKWNKESISESYEVFQTADLSLTELPESDVYLDDDEDGIYLEILKNRELSAIANRVNFESENSLYRVSSECRSFNLSFDEGNCSMDFGFKKSQKIEMGSELSSDLSVVFQNEVISNASDKDEPSMSCYYNIFPAA